MCFFTQQSQDATKLNKRFKAKVIEPQLLIPKQRIVGFEFPQTPVISNENSDIIQFYNWGLIPSWAKDNTIRKYTLNAKIETLHQKPSFKDNVSNRCLIIADGFYEWQWLDAKGKNKQQFLINLPNKEAFAFAGIWSNWIDQTTGELVKSYSIVTTEANEFMSKIHNSKKRMPIILTKENEEEWLGGKVMQEFRNVAVDLIAQSY
jgi:putative SOS response-associated peptidase YedK